MSVFNNISVRIFGYQSGAEAELASRFLLPRVAGEAVAKPEEILQL